MRLRRASLDDAVFIYECRNDPVSRKMSKTTKKIGWGTHMRWLKHRLCSENAVYIFENNAGMRIGTANVTMSRDGQKASYIIAPEHRGKGFARMMLAMLYVRRGRMICEIKEENIASIKAASDAGHTVVILKDGRARGKPPKISEHSPLPEPTQ